jgi:hypothetical protein
LKNEFDVSARNESARPDDLEELFDHQIRRRFGELIMPSSSLATWEPDSLAKTRPQCGGCVKQRYRLSLMCAQQSISGRNIRAVFVPANRLLRLR